MSLEELMRTLSSSVFVSVVVSMGLAASMGVAHAQVAEQLFREGKRLMSEGKIAEACTAFEGSYRKEDAVTTLLNLADCREKNGQFASAWGHFIDAERKTRGNAAEGGFNTTAKDRASKLEGRLSYLIINVPDEARVDGLEITRNGQPVDAAEWNRDIPVDGGAWKVEGKAPAYEAWSTSVTVGKEKDKQSVNVPRFRALPENVVRPDGPRGPGPKPQDPPSSFTGKRKAAVGVGAVGVLGVVAGTVMYFQASGLYDDAKAATTNDERTSLTDDANGKYLVAQIGWGVGAAAIGAAAFLWFTGGPAAQEGPELNGLILTPRLDGESAGFVLGGRF